MVEGKIYYKPDPDSATILADLLRKPLFRRAASLIPTEHLQALVAAPDAYQPETLTSVGLTSHQVLLASNRWRDPICNTCWKKGNGVRLYRCTCCGLVHYCSTKCQAVQWERHREYVKHLPATPLPWKNDPNQVVIVKISDRKCTFLSASHDKSFLLNLQRWRSIERLAKSLTDRCNKNIKHLSSMFCEFIVREQITTSSCAVLTHCNQWGQFPNALHYLTNRL